MSCSVLDAVVDDVLATSSSVPKPKFFYDFAGLMRRS